MVFIPDDSLCGTGQPAVLRARGRAREDNNESCSAQLAGIEAPCWGSAGRQALAAALYQETEGNPFFIREVLSHLIEDGMLSRQNSRWTTKVTNVSELGIPEVIREAVDRRLPRLS